jgi:FAD binding domain/Berberine and berberine like
VRAWGCVRMSELGRRGFLAGALGGAAAGLLVPSAAAGAATGFPAGVPAAGAGGGRASATVTPEDVRYESLLRGNNHRFVGRPDHVVLARSTEDVVHAVAAAVRAGRRVAVRSGGHCFEGFVADPDVRVLIDLSELTSVHFDRSRRAFEIGPGATLGHLYRSLFRGWGVTVPGGGCPEVGVGGHFCGGGYGPLSRLHGSVVDHLYAVEVVVVDRSGRARAVVATREPDDPHRDLWWAHTGGGGGNFGVVTRYWLRAPGVTGADPPRALPAAPSQLLRSLVFWDWSTVDEQAFVTLLRNYGAWFEHNSAPGSPYAAVYNTFLVPHKAAGGLIMVAVADAGVPNAARLLTDHVGAITAGVSATPFVVGPEPMPWLHYMTWPGTGEAGDTNVRRYKNKAAYLRRSLTDRQLRTVHKHLTDGYAHPAAALLLVSYGGKANAVAPEATAVAQRDSVLKAIYATTWTNAAEDARHLGWLREFYRDVYADTGGVPVPGEVSDGSYINYPDIDLADPQWNTSGVPWHDLYYKQNYPRLQRIKAAWDPRDVFHHALSIRPPN